MALVYRPTTQTIFPKNAIPWNDFLRQGVTFTFNGVVCNLVEIQMSSGVTNPTKTSQFFNVTYYNFDRVNVKWTTEMTAPYPTMYRVGVGGMPIIIFPSETENVIFVQSHNLNTGDMIGINMGIELAPNLLFFYVGVIDVDNFMLYSTRELAISNNPTNATSISTYVGKTLYPWAYSDYVSIIFTNRNLNLQLNITDYIDNQTYTFKPTYNKPPVGNIVNSFYVVLYDNSGNILEQSETIYSNNIEYTVSGLINGNRYYIQFFVTDIYGFEYQTDRVNFYVNYVNLDININPTATNNCNDSSIDINIGLLSQNNGIVDGRYSYLDNYVKVGNSALFLSDDSTLIFKNLRLINQSYPIFTWMCPYENFQGKIVRMDDEKTGKYLEINYSNKNLELILDGNILQTVVFDYDIKQTYIIAIIDLQIYINEYYTHVISPVPDIPVIGSVTNVSTTMFNLKLNPNVPNLLPDNFDLKKLRNK